MKDLGGKVAVVTGGASGIGHAMATRFASEGMKLVLVEAAALSDAAYRWFARNRLSLTGRGDACGGGSCALPSKDEAT
jgi:NAD(P)-dependent dehydrogenase (short-subunit alcohol dehydrogenase family)